MNIEVISAIPEYLREEVIIDIHNNYIELENFEMKDSSFQKMIEDENRIRIDLCIPDDDQYHFRKFRSSVKIIIRVEIDTNISGPLDPDTSYYRKALEDIKKILIKLQPRNVAFPLQMFRWCKIDTSISDTINMIMDLLFSQECYFDFRLYTCDQYINVITTQANLALNSYVDNLFSISDENNNEIVSKIENRNESKQNDRKLSLDDFIAKYKTNSFDLLLFQYMNQNNVKSSALYEKAQISKQDFHRIISTSEIPSNIKNQKDKIIGLLLAQKLDFMTFNETMAVRGVAFSDSCEKDLVIQHCIINGIYNIDEINSILYKRNIELLGNSISS